MRYRSAASEVTLLLRISVHTACYMPVSFTGEGQTLDGLILALLAEGENPAKLCAHWVIVVTQDNDYDYLPRRCFTRKVWP